MDRITLSDAQLSVVAHSHEPVAVHDEEGKLRGYIAVVIGSDELAEAKRASASQEARFTTSEVLAELQRRTAP
jgi:hypothetical protein